MKARTGKRGPRITADDAAMSAALGERVRQRRGHLGLSQQELGRRIGLTFQQVQKYERGTNRISVPLLMRLAVALDTTPAALLDGLDRAGGTPPTSAGNQPDRQSLALMGASRTLPEPIRRAMLDLARSLADSAAPVGPTGADAPAAQPIMVATPPAPAVARDAPVDRRGDEDPKAHTRPRRRRGAVWDPADILRAARRA